MTDQFRVEFLPGAVDFMERIDENARRKIYFNIRKSQIVLDPVLFKKLSNNIWEFRTLYNKSHYRLFAFWDKLDGKETLVLVTHGLVKQTAKTPRSDLHKAERIRQEYFDKKI